MRMMIPKNLEISGINRLTSQAHKYRFQTISGFPGRTIKLLVGVQGEAEVVRPRIGNILSDSGDLADDDKIVPLSFVIDGPVAGEGVDEIVVDARSLRSEERRVGKEG